MLKGVLLLFFIFYLPIRSQSAEDSVKLNKELLKRNIRDFGRILTAPVHWSPAEWYIFSALAGTSLFLYSQDEDIHDYIQRKRSPFGNTLSCIVEPFGKGMVILAAVPTYYILGALFKNYRIKKTAIMTAQSLVVMAIMVEGTKYFTGRHRPKTGDSHNSCDSFSNHDAFPSGHTALMFSIATVLSYEYKEQKWVPPVTFGIATLTALSRMNDGAHWASDILVGFGIGYFITKTIVNGYPEGESKVRVQIQPTGIGLTISLP